VDVFYATHGYLNKINTLKLILF